MSAFERTLKYHIVSYRIFRNFFGVLRMAVARSSGGGVVICLRISGFVDDVIFAHKLRLLDVAAGLRQ